MSEGGPVYCQAIALPAPSTAVPPEWVHLLPAGVIRTIDGRGPYRMGDADALAAHSLARGGGQLVLDENHSTDLAAPKGEASPARGWIRKLDVRADGIWGEVDWTESGKALMADRAYRFISPVITHTKEGLITAVLRASLVNTPNLRGLTALASSETMAMNDSDLAQIRGLLGLPADAGAPAIVEKIAALIAERVAATQSPDPAKFVPIGDFERVVAEVQHLSQGVSLQAATDHVFRQIREANMPPFLKDWGVVLCTVNKPAFDAFIERTKGLFNRLVAASGASANPPPEKGFGAQLTEEETALCMRMGLSAEEFLKSRAFLETAKG